MLLVRKQEGLEGRTVCVFPQRSTGGRDHAFTVAQSAATLSTAGWDTGLVLQVLLLVLQVLLVPISCGGVWYRVLSRVTALQDVTCHFCKASDVQAGCAPAARRAGNLACRCLLLHTLSLMAAHHSILLRIILGYCSPEEQQPRPPTGHGMLEALELLQEDAEESLWWFPYVEGRKLPWPIDT